MKCVLSFEWIDIFAFLKPEQIFTCDKNYEYALIRENFTMSKI